MKTTILQILIIEGVITIEFKLTRDNGPATYISKALETMDDFEAFKHDLANGIETLEDIIKHELKSNSNGNKGNRQKDMQPAAIVGAKVL